MIDYSENINFLKTLKNYEYEDIDKINNVRALIVPHASLLFGGDLSFIIFNKINFMNYEKIIILSTHHRSGSFIPKSSNFKFEDFTIVLDDEYLTNIKKDDNMFNNEHSWLTTLYFLTKVKKGNDNIFGGKMIKNISILLIGNDNNSNISTTLDLKTKFESNDKVLIICNTDLMHCGSHFGNKCFHKVSRFNCPDFSSIDSVNMDTIDTIQNINIQKFNQIKYFNRLCGVDVVEMFLNLINNGKICWFKYFYDSSDSKLRKKQCKKTSYHVKYFDYANFNSVGYPGIIYVNKLKFQDSLRELVSLPKLILNEKIILDKLDQVNSKFYYVEDAEITNMLNDKENGSSLIDKYSLNYCYDDKKGIFTTIKNDEDELKGCLGTFILYDKIAYYIAYYTVKSLLQDIRFHPNGLVKKNEVKELNYSVNFIGEEMLIYPDQLISFDTKNFKINQLVFESFKKYYKLRIHGVKIYYEDDKFSTYLASVVFDNLRIKNIENLTQNKIDSLLEELRIKANTNKNIIQITIYECEEYSIIDEQLKQNLMPIKT
tara:strand:+ start:29 stop:1660 length:1632 start_codon:yes stop_codon:yes gene_type:complete